MLKSKKTIIALFSILLLVVIATGVGTQYLKGSTTDTPPSLDDAMSKLEASVENISTDDCIPVSTDDLTPAATSGDDETPPSLGSAGSSLLKLAGLSPSEPDCPPEEGMGGAGNTGNNSNQNGNNEGDRNQAEQSTQQGFKLVFTAPELEENNFKKESNSIYTYNTPVQVDFTNQTPAQFKFYATQGTNVTSSIFSKIKAPSTDAPTKEKNLTTQNGGKLTISSNQTGSSNIFTIDWNKTCDATTDCSTLTKDYYIEFQATPLQNPNNASTVIYQIPLELKMPFLGKLITSCSEAVNVGEEVLCTGKIPNTLEDANAPKELTIKLLEQTGERKEVEGSSAKCEIKDKKITCKGKAPSKAGKFYIVAEGKTEANTEIAQEQVGELTVIDPSDYLSIIAKTPINIGEASPITIAVTDEAELISLTAKIQGPNKYDKSLYFECHESLTAFECPKKVKDKITDKKIPLTWQATDTLPGIYTIAAFARISNEEEPIVATAQIEVKSGSCNTYFADVDANDPICEALVFARENGIFLGKEGKNNTRIADLKSGLSRAEFFALAARLYQKTAPADAQASQKRLRAFRDVSPQMVNDPAHKYWIDAIVALDGIVEGYGDGTLRPQAPLSMAELAKVVGLATNLIGNYNKFAEPWYADIINIYRQLGINLNPEMPANRGTTVKLIYDSLQASGQQYFNLVLTPNLERLDLSPQEEEDLLLKLTAPDAFTRRY